ncbi:MAG: hypothetical protein H0T53_11545 [Herpetosiphonaceae bacterium]|nr:hypothetical protein [Herpetosiphonaceae bacterium]
MTRYKLQTLQFGIVSGIRQDISDRISSAVPGNLFAPEARKGQLFVLTEAVNETSRGKEACDLVAKTITATYYKDSSFSITSSLRHALKSANTMLYEHNYKAAHHQKTAVSLTCAVLRDNDLYIAQVQPTQAYIAHKGQLRALPTYPSWQAGSASPSMLLPNALGTSLFSEPELYRNVLEPGDEVILCSSRLARVLGRAEAERLFCLEDAPSALEELYNIARRNTLTEAHVAVIELLPIVTAAAQSAPLSAEGISERGKAAANAVGDWLSDVTGNAALLLRRPAAHEHDESIEAAGSIHGLQPSDDIHPTSAITEAPVLPSVLEDIDPRDMNWLRGRSRVRPRVTADTEVWPPSAFLGEGSAVPIMSAIASRSAIDLGDHEPLPVDFAAIPQRDPIPPATAGQRITAPFRYLMAAIVTFFANLGRSKRPSAAPLPRFEQSSRGLSYRRTKQRNLPYTAIFALILLGVVGYFVLQNRMLENNETSYQNAFNEANQQLASANQAPTDAEALAKLTTLETLLISMGEDTGLLDDPTREANYKNLRTKADDLRASIERTSLLKNLELAASLPTTNTNDLIGRLLAVPNDATTDLYFLANESGTLYQQQAGSKSPPTVVLAEGAEVPPTIAARIRSMVWREGALAAIDDDEASTAFLSQPDGAWFTPRLDGSELWPAQPFPDIETFGGNLYIWIRGQDSTGQILKYASGEYTSLPTEWITDVPLDVELKSAVDMAIDGKIYLLRSDGAIVVFDAGVYERTIPVPELNPPLTASKMALSNVRPDVGTETHFFIMDTINQRIVELDQDGQMVQQLRVPATSPIKLDKLTDLAVTPPGPQGRQLYIANGSQVFSTVIPAPPAPRKINGSGQAGTTTPAITPTP